MKYLAAILIYRPKGESDSKTNSQQVLLCLLDHSILRRLAWGIWEIPLNESHFQWVLIWEGVTLKRRVTLLSGNIWTLEGRAEFHALLQVWLVFKTHFPNTLIKSAEQTKRVNRWDKPSASIRILNLYQPSKGLIETMTCA